MAINDILIRLGFKPHKSNWLHFIVGCLIGFPTFIFCFYQMEFSVWMSIGLGVALATAIGCLKEILDRPNFDWLDLIMTALGGFTGCMVAVPITWVL